MFLFCLVFALSLCASVYMCFVVTCWERADLLALVCGVCCEFVTFPLVSWVRCGTWLYRFLIFAPLLTLNVFYWRQIIVLDSVVIKAQALFSSHEGFLTNAMQPHRELTMAKQSKGSWLADSLKKTSSWATVGPSKYKHQAPTNG